ncbi:MAG: outer membrane protein assembly factor BamE [Pseudomonadota bacterium]
MVQTRSRMRLGLSAAALSLALVVSGCNSMSQTFQHGYQLNEESLALVPEGSSREQVLLSLGTPSTTQRDFNGNETYYYISQKKTKPVAFAKSSVVDQRVLAVYFNDESTVSQIANYGLQDGKVFDFIGRVTPTGGRELTFLSQLLGAASSIANPFGGGGGNPGNL